VKCGIVSIVLRCARQPTVRRATTENEYVAAGVLA
jgi:hypothetical protein